MGDRREKGKWQCRTLASISRSQHRRSPSPNRNLAKAIVRLAQIRRHSPAPKYGNYEQILVKYEQLAFARQAAEECVICVVNASDEPVAIHLDVPRQDTNRLVDVLNGGESFAVIDGNARIDPVWLCWARILVTG